MNEYVESALAKLDCLADGAQTFFEELGKNGCYLFCLAKIAGCKGAGFFVRCVLKGVEKGWIEYGGRGDIDNFTVCDPCAFLGEMTGKKWTVRKLGAEYEAKSGEREVLVYKSNITGATHFRLADYDPLESSVTVRTGHVESKRIFNAID